MDVNDNVAKEELAFFTNNVPNELLIILLEECLHSNGRSF